MVLPLLLLVLLALEALTTTPAALPALGATLIFLQVDTLEAIVKGESSTMLSCSNSESFSLSLSMHVAGGVVKVYYEHHTYFVHTNIRIRLSLIRSLWVLLDVVSSGTYISL